MKTMPKSAEIPARAGVFALFALVLSFLSPVFSGGALGAESPTTLAAGRSTSMRTVLRYVQGPWTSPAAIVLRSELEWIRWNEAMVASNRAVASEPTPAGVDWAREVLLVVTLGEQPTIVRFELDPPRRTGRTLWITGRIEVTSTQSFSAPCHVVALDRRYANDIVLDPRLGVLESLVGVLPGPGNRATGSSDALFPIVTSSWGAVKDRYH